MGRHGTMVTPQSLKVASGRASTVRSALRLAGLAYKHRSGIAKGARYLQKAMFGKSAVSKSNGLGRPSGSRGGNIVGTKKFKKLNRRSKYAKSVKASVQIEVARQISGNGVDSMYVGHSTMPSVYTGKAVALAMLKQLFIKLGRNIPDFEAVVEDSVSGDNITIAYRPNELVSNNETYINIPLYVVGVQQTYLQIATAITSFIVSYTDQLQLVSIAYTTIPGTSILPSMKFNLLNAKLHYSCTSILKFQNRTHETGSDEMFDYDNDPVFIRGYEGKGNGSDYTVTTNNLIPFYADQYGVFNFTSQVNSTKMPPNGLTFKNVTRTGTSKLEMGGIKISTLKDSHTMSLNKFVNDTETYGGPVAYEKLSMGKFRFFGLEKLIRLSAGANVSFVGEVKHMIQCHVTFGGMDYSTQVVYIV